MRPSSQLIRFDETPVSDKWVLRPSAEGDWMDATEVLLELRARDTAITKLRAQLRGVSAQLAALAKSILEV